MEYSDRREFALGLVRIVELHDAETATHLKATGALAGRIAAALHLRPAVAAAVELAGLLHDVGKIAVGRDILRKPGGLTAREWVTMRLHAEQGAHVLEVLPRLAGLAPIVRAHHERMDGCGYPDHLRGEEIPFEARVVAVADAFHALTTDRPYRRAILPQAALQVLEAAAGPQFDPHVVAATRAIFGGQRTARPMTA